MSTPIALVSVNVTVACVILPIPTALRLIKTPLLSVTVSICNCVPSTECPVAAISACNHWFSVFGAHVCLFTKTHTASQFAGPSVTDQLLSHFIVNVTVLPLTVGVPITKLFAKEIELIAKLKIK